MPDKVGIRNLDGGLAESKVNGALELGDIAVDRVVGTDSRLDSGESCQELLKDGTGEGADGVAAVKNDSIAAGLGKDGVLGTVVLSEAHAVEVNPVSIPQLEEIPYKHESQTYRVWPSGADAAGMMGRFSR